MHVPNIHAQHIHIHTCTISACTTHTLTTHNKPFIPKTQFEKPHVPRGPLEIGTVSRSSVDISWLPPDHDGGAAVNAYIIERRERGRMDWSHVARIKPHTCSYRIMNLLENTEYQFRVYAENIEGYGKPLVLDYWVAARRPVSIPDAPAGRLKVRKVTGDSVLIEWNSPYDEGGSRITKYIIEFRDVDSFLWERAATVDNFTRQCQIIGLYQNCEYLFRVFAVNEVGQSEPLESEISIRPIRKSEPPSMPGGPLVVSDVLKHSMTLAWQPPVSDGGSPITGYIIERRDTHSLSSWSRIDRVKSHFFSYTISNLVEGHRYYYRVIAENSVGRSAPLESHTSHEAKSPYSPPQAPGSIRVIGITEDGMTIEWSHPPMTGGAPVTSYVIEKREQKSHIWTHVSTVSSRTSSYEITYLQPNCSYYIRVAAENEEGIGPFRELYEPVRPMRPKNLPSSPMNITVDYITRDTVTVKWDRPDDTGGVPLSGYVVEQRDGKSGRWQVVAYVEPYRQWWTIHNLIQGYRYDFRVRAENPDGVGPPRGLGQPVVPRPVVWRPSAPQLLEVVDVGEDNVTLSWLAPINDGGSRIFRYTIERCDVLRADGWIRVKEVDSSDILVACIEGLQEGRPYLFRVYAENEVGLGPSAELRDTIVPRSQLGPPSSPDGPIRVIRVTRNMLAIHWSPPLDNGGSPIERYIIEKREADRSHWTQAGTCSPEITAYCVTDLAENQMYYFRVLAENAYGYSEPLELERPVIPKRVFESASKMELESWIREAHVSSSEVTKIIQHVSEASERSYLAYADEPLTTTHDTLDTMWLSRY